jgi:hypothetical protein
MSIRGPTGKFFYDRVHDVYLYHLVLEHHVYDEVKDDFLYTRSGEIKLSCGWKGIAKKMTAVFGREFSKNSIQNRYGLLFNTQSDDPEQEKLFNETMDFGDDLARLMSVMES